MSHVFKFFVLTDRERETLDKLIELRDVKLVAQILGERPQTVRQRLYRLRLRYQKARDLVKLLDMYRAKLPVRWLE